MTGSGEEQERFDEALALAIARYVREHGRVAGTAEWLTPEVEFWIVVPPGELEQEAERRRGELERWRDEARSAGSWNPHRIAWMQAMQWLGSARTGSFETSSGRLFDFLVSVGAPTREFEVF